MKSLLRGIIAASLGINLMHAEIKDSPEGATTLRPRSIRLLCLSIDRPSVFTSAGGGLAKTSFEKAENNPPEILFRKFEKTYKQIPISRNTLSAPWTTIGNESKCTLYLKTASQPSSKGQNNNLETKDEMAPLIEFETIAEDQIVCLYQNSLDLPWAPPQRAIVDISRKKLNPNSILVLNTTSHSIYFGSAGPIKVIEPGHALAFQLYQDANKATPIKLAAKLPTGNIIKLADMSKIFQPDSRMLIAVHNAHPKHSGRTVDYRILRIPDITPESGEPSVK